jgi:hypothetical protein
MNFKFILTGLPLTLIFLSNNPQPSLAGCNSETTCARYTKWGRYHPGRKELIMLEQLIEKGQANANDYFRAGELYTQLGDKDMAQSRFNNARKLFANQGNRQGVMNVNQKLEILKTLPSQIQIQQRQ